MLPAADRRPPPRRSRRARRAAAALGLAALSSGACGGDGGGPSEPAQEGRETCAAAVRLAVGESAPLAAAPDGRVLCRVDAGAGAEFAVAFVDTRATRWAETGPEGYGGVFPDYAVAVSTGEEVRGVPSPARAALAPPHDFVRVAMAAAPPPAAAPTRATPWSLGERFPLYDPGTGGARTAQVLRVYDGGWVVAWYEGDAAPGLPRYLAQLDSAWALMREHALPLLRTAYSGEEPRTSPGSGQYLLVLRAEGRAGAYGWTSADRSFGGAPRLWTDVKVLDLDGGSLRLAELLAHEVGHAYQAMYMHRTRPGGAGESAAGAAFWGVEGGADLVSFETVRRAAGAPLTANLDGAGAAPGPPRRLRQWAQPGSGVLTDGYASAAGFLRVQAARRVAAGEGEDEALAEVLRGASDGWFGYDHTGARRPGLTERMRARLGAEWSPEDALLDWALAHAADDETPSPRYQDLTFLRVRAIPGAVGSWQPFTALDGGAGVAGSQRGYGSPHYLLLRGAGELRFSAASDVGGVRWRILRVR